MPNVHTQLTVGSFTVAVTLHRKIPHNPPKDSFGKNPPANNPIKNQSQLLQAIAITFAKKIMGLIYANISLSNPTTESLLPIEANALVDTGALFLCIPQHIALQLQLKEFEKREVTVADGSKKLVPYVGPIKINYLNRMCLTGALVLGDMVLLGAIPIEDMDLVIHPSQLKITVNPNYPNIAGTLAV